MKATCRPMIRKMRISFLPMVSHLHLNPASHYPSIFISSVGKLDSSNIEVKFSENNAGYVAVFDDVKSA